jgi:threonine dehydratase
LLNLKFVEHVRAYVSGLALRTPVVPSEWLSEAYKGTVSLKCENLQHTGSFKVRGPLARFPWLTKEERMMGVLCASAGNHGKGLAWAAKHYGVNCTVCVPKTIPENKEKAIRKFGATVIKTPHASYDETEKYAIEQAKKTGRVWISPYDDDHIQAGQRRHDRPRDLRGHAQEARLHRRAGRRRRAGDRHGRRGARGLAQDEDHRREHGRVAGDVDVRRDKKAHTTVESKPTIAEGLEGGVSERTYERGLKYIDEMVVVKESHLKKVVAEMMRRHRVAIEGSAAVGPSAILEGLIPQASSGSAS